MNLDVDVDESAELLRWRAELLLDEMMLGAVDASAGDSRPYTGRGAAAFSEDAWHPVGLSGTDVAATLAAHHPHSSLSAAVGNTSAGSSDTVGVSSLPPVQQASDPSQGSVVSVDQRYARYVRSQPAEIPALPATNRGNGASSAPYAANAPSGNQVYSAPALGPVRRTPSAVLTAGETTAQVGSMSVGGRGNKYANLLPRNSVWDARDMQREIVALNGEIDALLPPTNSTRERAHHLLEKANGILTSDPLRSAEVDYYLAQVRVIVQRVEQRVEWSGIYRTRLMLYLYAWVALSVVMVIGCILYGPAIASLFGTWFGWGADSVWAQNIAPLLATAFAGSLGGSVGALINMRRATQRGVSFVDRKYSLRGLVLPMLGFVAGLILYPLFGVAFWLLALSPDQFMLAELLPVSVACLFGLFQESIYGTRE